MPAPTRTDVPTLVASGTDKLVLGPPAFATYVRSGGSMSSWRRDIATAFNQVPRWAYGVIAALALYAAYKSYQGWKKGSGAGSGAGP